MRVRVQLPEPEASTISVLLKSAGHEIVSDADPDTPVSVVLVDPDVSPLERWVDADTDAHVIVCCHRSSVVGLPTAVSDFVTPGTSADEVLARIERLQDRPSPQEVARARLLSTAVESAGDVIELLDSDNVMLYVNPAYEQTLGWSPEDAIGKSPAELVRSDYHGPDHFQQIAATLGRKEMWTGLLVSRSRAGQNVFCETRISPITDRHGNVTHYVAVRRDITERLAQEKKLEEASESMRQARDEAVNADRAKTDFLANMSHELRTPLNAIIGYSELLMEDLEGSVAESAIEDLRRIERSGRHLLVLINDVLDMSKIEAGRMELHPEEFRVEQLLEEALEVARPLIAAAKNELVVEAAQRDSLLYADRTRLRQVLLNLLGNAAKFTSKGKVTLRAELPTRGVLRLEVEDTGIGIEPEVQKRLFKPFVQASSTTVNQYGGTGLGLAISRRICEMMGGAIRLQSEPGRGSRFEVIVPQDARSGSTAEKWLRERA